MPRVAYAPAAPAGAATAISVAMDLTHTRLSSSRFVEEPRISAGLAGAIVAAALILILWLDRATASAPVQHLYYLPIIFAAMSARGHKGLLTAVTAVVFYHLANPRIWTLRYEEADIVQVGVFVAVGVVADLVARDRRLLHRLAITDDLTGLHNLRSFEARLRAMVREAAATARPLSLMVLDLDRLKSLNDAHGHLAGAEAVRTVGHILAERLPARAAACRYGGDEFVVAVPDTSRAEACAIAEELRHAVESTAPVLAGMAFPAGTLSISIGVADRTFARGQSRSEPEATAGEQLFRAADAALYSAKSRGRNRIGCA